MPEWIKRKLEGLNEIDNNAVHKRGIQWRYRNSEKNQIL
jgi:hypothetical protein